MTSRSLTCLLLALGLSLGQNVAAEEVQIRHGELTLNANLEAVEDTWPKGPVVLLTHGTLAHGGMEIMVALQEAFTEAGVSTLAITLSLGLDARRGMYPCETPHTHRHTDALDEIGAWIEWLQSKGATRVFLLGHSRGGNQAAWYAAERNPAGVEGVILVAPSTWNEDAAAKSFEKRNGAPLEESLSQAREAVQEDAAAWMEPPGFIYCRDTRVTAGAFVSYYEPDPRFHTPTVIPSISEPVLIFAGSEDEVVKGLEDAVAPVADGVRVRLEVIDGADHFFRDLYAEDLVEMAAEFIMEAR